MSLPSSVRSLSGGVITFLMALTLLATQQLQPLLASQVDDSRHSAPFVSFLQDLSRPMVDGIFNNVEGPVKNNLVDLPGGIYQDYTGCQTAPYTSNDSKGCRDSAKLYMRNNSTESQCSLASEQFECVRVAACRLCDKTAATSIMQQAKLDGQDLNSLTAKCAQFGFQPSMSCPTSTKTIYITIFCVILGIFLVVFVAMFAIFRTELFKNGSQFGDSKSAIQTGAGGTSKSSSKIGSMSWSKSSSKSSSNSSSKNSSKSSSKSASKCASKSTPKSSSKSAPKSAEFVVNNLELEKYPGFAPHCFNPTYYNNSNSTIRQDLPSGRADKWEVHLA